MTLPLHKRLSNDQLQALLDKGNWVQDVGRWERLQNVERGVMAFVNIYVNSETDEVIIAGQFDNTFLMKLEDFEKFIAWKQSSYDQPLKPMHVLEDRFPYEADFPSHMPALIQQAPAMFKIAPDDLDLSMESLQAFDKAVEKIGMYVCLELPYFPVIVAYACEAMQRATKGRMEMRQSVDFPDIWEPWVVPEVGKAIHVGHWVVHALDEDIPMSLYGRLEAMRFLATGQRRE